MSTDDGPPAGFRDELRQLYVDLADEQARIGPACAVSGRCCRFHEYEHTLFLSATEAEILVREAPPPARPLDDGATCPWQDRANRCTAREARPLGCRLYYCDPAYQEHLPAIGESFTGRLKRLIDRYGLEWGYAPLHRHLAAAREEGRLADPEPQGSPG
jgi:hypothetical protein